MNDGRKPPTVDAKAVERVMMRHTKTQGRGRKAQNRWKKKKAATTQKCQATAPGEDTKSYQAIDEIGNDVEDAVAATTH